MADDEPELGRFCVYKPLSDPPQPFVAPPGLQAARDRLSISMSAAVVEGSPLAANSNAVAAVLSQEFLRQAGHLPLPDLGPETVQLTLLDSQPDGPLSNRPPLPPGSQHGYTLAHLAQELVCEGACAATIINQRALNYADTSLIPLAPGLAGSIGTISDLGRAIVEAVRGCSRGKHLILNLSIGWDAEIPLAGLTRDLDARRVSELEPAVQFVYQALQLAARKGVLVIAAAGNRRGGPDDSNWPILPAAWELRHPLRSPFAPKLIYAVGGVDWQGLPLPNSRTKGLPVRVAYGDHATAEVDDTPTAMYTGTSVSTVVVSAAAALVWRLRPELTPAEVMRLIDRSGERQEARAEFYAGRDRWFSPLRSAPRLQEISLCAAVREACGPKGQSCSAAGDPASGCRPLDHQPAAVASILSQPDFVPSPDPGTLAPSASVLAPLTPPCHAGTLLLTVSDPISLPVCPTDQFSSVWAQPWVLPQPGDDPCPNCTLVPTGPPFKAQALAPEAFVTVSSGPAEPNRYQLAIALSQRWLDALKDTSLNITAMLDIDRFEKGTFTRRTYPVQIDRAKALAWTAFGFGDGKSLKGCRAQLNFIVTKAGEAASASVTVMSVQNPVLVDPGVDDPTAVAVRSLGLGESSANVATAGRRERQRITKPPL